MHPLHFANQLLLVRNRAQREGMRLATLSQVLAYRGEPSAEHDPKPYSRNQAQKAHWERDQRVSVTLRPLKYQYEYDAAGSPVVDTAGRRIIKGKSEKGVDVLCALAVVREARHPGVDLVILASHDSDLEPALDEAIPMGTAKIETFSWYDSSQKRGCRQLRPNGRQIWNTRLGETEFTNCRDRNDYT